MRFDSNDITVTINRERIDVTLGLPTPNESWRYTDRAGHTHRYDHGYPTLELVEDEGHWCDGTEGYALHDRHWQVDRSHYECPLCGEVVEPALDPPFTPKSVPGMVDARISGTRSDGVHIDAFLTADDVARLRGQDAAAMQSFLDALPDEQIIARSFTGG